MSSFAVRAFARFGGAVAALGLAFEAAAAPPPPVPLEVYGQLPAVEDIELSPTGGRLAYIAVAGDRRQLIVQESNGTLLARIDAGAAKVRGLAWAGPDHLLITTSTTADLPEFTAKQEWSQVVSYNLKTRKSTLLLRDTPDTLNAVLGAPFVAQHRGEPTVFVRGVSLLGEGRYDLYRVDLDTGRGRIHSEGTVNTWDWIVGPDGAPVARAEHDTRSGVSRILLRRDRGWREEFASKDSDEAPQLIGLGRTPGTILLGVDKGEHTRLFEASVTGGPLGEPIDDAAKPVSSTLHDPATGRALAMVHLSDRREYVFFDPTHARAWRRTVNGFKGQQVDLESWTPDFSRIVVRVEGPGTAGVYYGVDLATNRADPLADARPDIPAEAIASVRSLSYKAADGLEIPAYLTLPVGREAKGLPLIVMPHGGPASRDEPGFDYWTQALASRGYAVLQPQFRGSSGYGRKFMEAGHGEWGRKMQTDLSDGVRHLAAQGMIDPKRVCIMGASYGGYAALAGVTLEDGVYRCAVSVNGVGDLKAMLTADARAAGGANTTTIRYWTELLGASYRDRGQLDVISPTRQVHKASAPILVIHGKDDTVVPYAQSADFARAAKRAGKPVEFVTLAGEDHWLSRGPTRAQMLRSAVEFVEKHNPPQ